MPTIIQFRRDTAVNWSSVNPTLAQAELGLELDTRKYKLGDGITAWNSLPYGALNGNVEQLALNAVTGTPVAPITGLTMYAGPVAGRIMPQWIAPDGADTPVQPFLGFNRVARWNPAGNSAVMPGVDGYNTPTIVGSVVARNVTDTNVFNRMRRIGIVTTAATGSLASFRQLAAQIFLGDGSGFKGFMKVIRFGCSDVDPVWASRTFVGISSSLLAPTNVEPSTLTNSIGVGHGAADTNLRLYFGGSAAQTPINLGANFPVNTTSIDAYELMLFSPPHQIGVVHYRVTRLNTGHVAEGTLPASNGANLPATTTPLCYCWGYRTNNTTALVAGIDIMSDYVETNY